MNEQGHNSNEHVKAFVSRVQRINDEIQGLQQDRKEIFAEAKAMGFSVKALKHVIKELSLSATERNERDAERELYEAAVGIMRNQGDLGV